MKHSFFGIASLLFASVTFASPHIVLDRIIEVNPPAGYCALGETPRQRELLEREKSLQAPAGVLLQIAVPCVDLKRFDAGAIDGFARRAQVMVVKARGQLKIDGRSSQEFLRSFGGERPVNINSVNTRLREALSENNLSASLQHMTPIGSDSTAFYWSAVVEVQARDGRRQKSASVAAAVLVNGLPLSVQAYELAGETVGPAPASVVQNYVQAILKRN